jgi:hypothetical protein
MSELATRGATDGIIGGDRVSVVGQIPRYAVLFRTHMWDPFIARQFARVQERVGAGDVYVVANNTSGSCNAIEGVRLVTFTEAQIEALGYARGISANDMVWFNVDYALYYFARQQPDYDYYVLFEYDVLVNADLDRVLEMVAERGADFVGLSEGEPVSEWRYKSSCGGIYAEADVRKMLFPLGILSKRAVDYLSMRRLQLSERLRSGDIQTWPHCEAFIATELSLGGFCVDELSAYGSIDRFSFAPAYLEEDLGTLAGASFVHPLLDTNRYISSTIKYEWKPERFFLPRSVFRRRLSRFPWRSYMRPLIQALRLRLRQVPTKLVQTLHRPASQ